MVSSSDGVPESTWDGAVTLGGAAGTDGGELIPGALTEEAVLPVEDHTIHAEWEQDQAALAELNEGGGQLVLIPREAMHQGMSPLIGVLALVDGVNRDGEGRWRMARCFGLRRVDVLGTEQRGALLLVRVGEVPAQGEAPAADLARLRRLRARVLRTRGLRSSSELFPDLPDVSPDRLADLLAEEIQASSHARLALLSAVSWVDRLAMLEKLTKPRRHRRLIRPRVHSAPDNLEERVKAAALPDGVRRVAERDLARSAGSHGAGNKEAVEVLVDLQWTRPPASPIDASLARQLLEASHAGLEDAKQAVMDFLVVLEWQRRHGLTQAAAPTLCLVGAPGTGKSTLVDSIARAMGRRLERLAIGGVDDVFLIGADRTYNRSRPGEIVRRLRASQVHPSQLVFLLDEIDKARGDPYRSPLPVLLSLLDPSQNSAFQDHFLDGVRIDLSGCLFVATANEKQAIPLPLLDRLQFIEVPSYSQEEQLDIARSKLLPKLLGQLGISDELWLDAPAVRSLVFDHPHSPGCRKLEQRLQLVISRALRLYMEREAPVVVDVGMVRAWLPPAPGRNIGFRTRSDQSPLPAERVPTHNASIL